jgi:hypothetical protein
MEEKVSSEDIVVVEVAVVEVVEVVAVVAVVAVVVVDRSFGCWKEGKRAFI